MSQNLEPSKSEVKEQVISKEVVRIFLLQSASSEEVNDNTDLKNFQFTRVVMPWKDDYDDGKKIYKTNNKNQITPIGGNVEEGETLGQAAKREALQETHLIFSDLKKMEATQEYTFLNKNKKEKRKSAFFIGRLFSPRFDVPYAINNKEDKIGGFVSLTLDSLVSLFKDGKFKGKEILDSLNTESSYRLSKGTEAKGYQINAVKKELFDQVKKSEIQKKMAVLGVLFNCGFTQKQEKSKSEFLELKKGFEDLKTNPGKTENFYIKLELFWRNNIDKIAGATENFKVAMRFANIMEILEDIKPEESGKVLPTLYMMVPLLFGFNFNLKLLPLLKENIHLSKIYTMIRVLFLYNEYLDNQNENVFSSRFLRKILGLKKDKVVNQEDIANFFKEQKLLPKSLETSFKVLGSQVDRFFDDLQKESKIPESSLQLSGSPEIVGAELPEILDFAFSKDETGANKLLKFEAQRKLLLIFILFSSKDYYDKILKKGIQGLDDLEMELESSESKKRDPKIRDRELVIGGANYHVKRDRRIKSLNSLLRKILVRDDLNLSENSMYNDIFAESYIFGNDLPEEKMKIEKRKVPENLRITNFQNQEIDNYEVPEIIHEFILDLNEKAKTKGEKIEIEQFKGLPKEGQGFQSNSTGGGAKVRFCKFYIKHMALDGTETSREAQFFLPKYEKGKWVSGEVDYEFKKNDDDQYAVSRLMSFGNVYSLIELLFPFYFYGDSMKKLFSVEDDNL